MKKNAWIAGVTAIMAAGLIFMAPVSARADDAIPAGVYVGEISLEGMTGAEAEQAVKAYVDAKLNQKVTLDVNGTQAETSAKELGMAWGNPDAVEEAMESTAVKGNLIKRYMKTKDLQENPVVVDLELEVDQEKVAAFVTENCGAALAEPQDATIVKEGDGFVITPSVTGVAIDMEATEEALKAALSADGTDGVHVVAGVTESEPRIKTEDLETIQDVLGSYTTGFSSSGWSRSTNLQVGTAKINGRVLMPGDVLSGYECMAPFTTANGYKTATAYENGRSVDSVGGGVCQIATTLYNAALYAELDIVQRQNHSMTVSYVDHSRDAAIAGTYKDIKISNPYDTPIYVEGYTSGKKLTFKIYGQETRPENREVKFESKTLQWINPGDPIEQPDPTLQPGQRVQVQSSHTGIRSELYKCVYVDGELQERTLLNKDSYNASKAIYNVGPALPAESAPAEGTPADGTVPTAPEAPVTPAPTEPQPAGPGAAAPAPTPAGPGAAAPTSTPEGPGAPTQAPGPGAPSGVLNPGATQGPQ